MENLTNITADASLDLSLLYISLGILPAITVFGNLLVIISVITEDKLFRHSTNHFIASLAACDMLVGFLVMPFAIYLKV